jgi:hypothetical protein
VANFNPSQTNFTGGEISPRAHGRVDSEVWRKALALCRNFQPQPIGSALMRAGSRYVGPWTDTNEPRLFSLARLGETDDLVVAINDSALRVYDRSTGLISVYTNLVTNGTFDAGTTGWTLGGAAAWDVGGFIGFTSAGISSATYPMTWTDTHKYTVRFRARRRSAAATTINIVAGVWGGTTHGLDTTQVLTSQWAAYTFTFTCTSTSSPGNNQLEFAMLSSNAWDLDDVFVTDDGTAAADHIDAPWTDAQIDEVQCSSDLARNRLIFVHPEVAPYLLTFNVHGLLELRIATFTAAPAEWGNANYPSTVDWGFQGRLWLGGTPDQPNQLWGSKSGYPFDFTTGNEPDDAIDVLLSSKGGIEWMMGHRQLLVGSEVGEHGVTGSSRIIAPGDIQVTDESAFGAASIQACHIGDQVVYVTPDRRNIRGLSYSTEGGGWSTKALTSLAEHLTLSLIREINWAKSPVPTLIALLDNGELIACTYDRSEQVLAWWSLDVGAPVRSCCVARTSAGAELWLSLTRAGDPVIERMSLYETPGVSGASISISYYTAGQDLTTDKYVWNNFVYGLVELYGMTVSASYLGTPLGAFLVQRVLYYGAPGVWLYYIELPAGTYNAGPVIVSTADTYGGTYLDSSVRGTCDDSGYFTGLLHLVGETVAIVIGDCLVDPQVVESHAAEGRITVPVADDGKSIVVGLPYRATLETLPMEGGLGTGSSQSAKRRHTKVRLRLNDSALPKVNGYRAPDRVPADPMDTSTDLITGDVDVQVLGWEEDGALTIEQDLPFRTEVLAIFGRGTAQEA